MKKRILAMLLLVAMIVTALPLMVLPSLAAEEEKEYTEADYNELYVDGIVFGADFYNTNKYWTNTAVSGTYSESAGATLLNGYRYDGAATAFSVDYGTVKVDGTSVDVKENTITIKDGYLDLHPFYMLSASGLNSKIGNAVNGATAQTIRTWVGTSGRAIHLMGVRISITASNGKHGAYSNGNYKVLDATKIDELNILENTNFSFADLAGVNTTTVLVQRPFPSNGNLDIRTVAGDVAYALSTYTPEGGTEGTMIDLAGSNNVTATDTYLCRSNPFKMMTPDYIKQADGTVVPNTEGVQYRCLLDRLMYGSLAVYDNRNKIYDTGAGKFPFINNDFLSNDTYIVLWGESGSSIAADKEAGKLYAVRYYAKELTDAEVLQNHFADIMKWFKIDLSVLDSVTAADYAKIAPAFAAFTFDSDKAEIEATLLAEVTELVNEKYAGTAGEAYVVLAAKYQLDLSPLLANPRGMLSNTYKFLNGGYLQVADVKAGYEAALAADYAAVWLDTPDTLDAYNYLYAAQDDALISLDFFGTNSIWNQTLAELTLPQETTNYKYAGVEYDFTKIEDRLIEADENVGILVKDGGKIKGYLAFNKSGTPTTGSANYPGGSDYTNSGITMPRQTFTEAEADKVIAEVQARTDDWGTKYTYDKVTLSLWMIWRVENANSAITYYTDPAYRTDKIGEWSASGVKAVQVYKTDAEAIAQIKAFVGDEVSANEDGSYTSADGKYTYYAAVRPVATAAYYQCVADYGANFVSTYIYGADINGTTAPTFKFGQNMKTVGEVNYQTQDGIHGQSGNLAMRSHVTFENGYMLLDPTDSGSYFGLSGTSATGTYYLDTVMTGGDKVLTGSAATKGTKIITFRGQRLMFAVGAADTSLVSVGPDTASVAAASNSIAGQNTPFRVTLASEWKETVTEGTKTYQKITMQTAINGTELIGADVLFNAGVNDQIGHDQASTARIYTYRVYSRILTDAEQAQNHFADIAKYFKLNITGYDALDADGKAAVHAAVKDLTFADDRLAVQNAVNAVLNAKVDATYEALAAKYPAHATFIETAREYRLDVADLLGNADVMPYLKALSLDGLTCAEAQALVDETAEDVLCFYVHMLDGEDAWNQWLFDVAAADTIDNIDWLLALPVAERVGVAEIENNTDAAAIEYYIVMASIKYSASLPEYDSYNALYVQDGILMGADFFKMNRYWNIEGIDYTVPVGPSHNTAYSYDVDGDGVAEVYDLTVKENRAITVTAEEDANKGKTLYAIASAEWRTAYTSFMNENFLWTSPSGMRFNVYGNKDETKEFAPIDAAAGYMQFRNDYNSSGGMTFTGITGGTTSTGQLIAAYAGAATETGKVAFLFHNIRPGYKVGKETINIYGMSGDSSVAGGYGITKYLPNDKGELKSSQGLVDGCSALTRSLMQPIAATYAATRAAELQALDAEAVYDVKKVDANNYEITKKVGEADAVSIEKYTVTAVSTPLTTNPDITLGYDTVIDLTQSVTLTDGYADWSLRTEQGTLVELNGVPYAKDANATLSALDANTHYIGWGSAQDAIKMYAFRQYDRVLSDAEIAQNHFADIAKFYRLDLSGYSMMDDEQKAATHKVFTAYTLDGALERDELQAILNEECKVLYEGVVIIEGDAEANAKFLELAVIATLDLAPIKNLTDAAREAFAYGMLYDFDPAYADAAIVAYHYAERTYAMAALTFAGYQVRLDTGASLANYAGVRAIFDIDEARIAKILEVEEKVTLTVSVTGDMTETTTFVYTMENGELKVDTDATIYDRNGGKSVNYTITYKDEDFTKDKLVAEASYSYSIKVGDAAATDFAVNSATFGDKVSAAKLYGYFYKNGYESDRMVADVQALIERAALLEGLTEVSDGLYFDGVDTYYVTNAAGLTTVAYEVNKVGEFEGNIFGGKTVKLMNDIDLGGVEWDPIGNFGNSSKQFTGIFDGQGYTVSNFKITKKTPDRAGKDRSPHGFFGNVSGTVKNLTVANATLDLPKPDGATIKWAGIFIGRLNGGTVENCHVVNSSILIENWQVGGLIGQLNGGDVIGCSVENVTVTGYAQAGALVGVYLLSGERVLKDCSVKNVAIVQNGSFGEGYDTMLGVVGATYTGSDAAGGPVSVAITNLTVEGMTINGVTADIVCGYIASGDSVTVDGVAIGE